MLSIAKHLRRADVPVQAAGVRQVPRRRLRPRPGAHRPGVTATDVAVLVGRASWSDYQGRINPGGSQRTVARRARVDHRTVAATYAKLRERGLLVGDRLLVEQFLPPSPHARSHSRQDLAAATNRARRRFFFRLAERVPHLTVCACHKPTGWGTRDPALDQPAMVYVGGGVVTEVDQLTAHVYHPEHLFSRIGRQV